MRPPASSLIVLACLIAGAALADRAGATASGETCSTTRLLCDGTSRFFTTASGQLAGSNSSAQFNLTSLSMGVLTGGFGSGRVEASDEYVVVGPAAGTPLVVTCRLAVSAGSAVGYDGWGSTEIVFSHATAGEVRVVTAGDQSRNEVLQLVLSVTAGQPFTLHFLVAASGGTGFAGAGTSGLAFDGLPAGARVSSCHGFVQDQPVPVAASSWGTLKARYR